jgi:hypothetical protein
MDLMEKMVTMVLQALKDQQEIKVIQEETDTKDFQE